MKTLTVSGIVPRNYPGEVMMTDATSATSATPTAVFVHGAWADASGFGGVIRALGDRGFAAIGVANPLRHLTGDAAYLAALLRTISGPIVLVGHSYGGAVMSNAAAGNEQVQALVFCNGWMPDEGESIQQLFEESEVFAGSLVPAAIRQVPFTNPDGSEGVDLYLDREAFPEAFAADVDPETARVMAATQRPWSGAGYAGPSGPPGWRSIPSWYLVGTEDRAIPPAGQRFMAERGNAQIEEVAASHASMVSQPEAVTRLILSAVEATSRSRR
jgi:pimeloyl-ACP methyl ester carboxylesterase